MTWRDVELGELCDVQRGTVITQSQARPGAVPVVAGGISSTYFHDTANRTGPTITVSASGANAGYVNFWTQPIFASDCSTVTANGESEADIRFVYRQLQYLQHYINSKLRSGAAQPHVYAKDIARLRIQVPALDEQRRIVAILDQADVLIEKRRQVLAELDGLTQSIFIEMFASKHSQDWKVRTIADVAAMRDGSIRTGPFGSQLLHSEFVAEGIAVLGIDNAVGNEFRWGERRFISEARYRDLHRYTVKPGDVLITIMGTCGRCAVVPDDIPTAINTKHLCCITLDPSKCLPEFLHAFFLRHPAARDYLDQASKGAIMSGLNMGLIKAMPISIPPLAFQHAFATRVRAVEALKTVHRAALAESDALFASLQHRAFTGQLS